VSEQVAERIRRLVRRQGPITFADYMEEALYGPGGFYMGTPIGSEGDFVTSPHVHPVFSRLVGMALEELWAVLGRPRPFRLVEMGAGDGTLASEIVAGFARGGIDVEYTAVELGSEARGRLATITSHVATRLADVERLDPGVLIANELLDNLPFRRVRRRGDALAEIRVGLDGDRLVEVEVPADENLTMTAPDLGDGTEAVIPTGAFAFADELARTLGRGYALLIDYGSNGSQAGEVHGYRGHRVVQDVLADPGSSDVTAGVDLRALADRAEAAGLVAFGTVSQGAALRALGYEEWMRGELAHQRELLHAGRGSEAARAWDGRNRARMLVEAAGLGRLRWLVLATRDLSEPDWLARAREGPLD
jgi:NADH dehydrogenase [ubiquinone] 1 alpha subcomplex assembly factor 7